MIKVIMNEQHGLMEEQRRILDALGSWGKVAVPSSGWTIEEMKLKVKELAGQEVIFVSPIPYMIAELSRLETVVDIHCAEVIDTNPRIRIFHNDRREKKELENGKVVYTVAKTGWQLI